jgi:hypothetical protein
MQRYNPNYPDGLVADQVRKYCEVTALMQQNKMADAWLKFQEYAAAMGNLGGALQVGLPPAGGPEQPVVVIDPPTIIAGNVLPWAQRAPGTSYAVQARSDGTIGCSIDSGGHKCWGNVADVAGSFPNIEGQTSAGQGATQPLRIKAGQWFTFKHEATEPKNMRVSMESL